MATAEPRSGAATHEVFNQSPPLAGYNVFEADTVLREAIAREGAEWANERLRRFGAECGRPDVIELGRLANENKPRLRTHDRFGNRIDEVEFHPAWHELMKIGVSHAIHAYPWLEPGPGAHVARAGGAMLLTQVEAGVMCPISMTYSVIPALRHQPELAAEWEPRFGSLDYDERLVPAIDKKGALCGMGMTEKQGGSDVRANTTTARPLNGGGPGAEYELTGHKWFMSAPMCDAFLVLAQAEGGISCFLMPRFLPDGERNRIHLQRLKDKLGQPLERLVRGRVPRRLGPPRRRGGRRRAHDHRDGQPHAPRLRGRLLGRDARSARPRRSTTPATARPSARRSSTSR